MDYRNLRAQILDEIGTDAYSRYDQERYAIPEIVIHILIDACILEFLKGFVDFESLGRDARAKVHKFLTDFRKSPDLVTLGLSAEATQALETASIPSEREIKSARKQVASLLVDYGMHQDIANSHAEEITKLIVLAIDK